MIPEGPPEVHVARGSKMPGYILRENRSLITACTANCLTKYQLPCTCLDHQIAGRLFPESVSGTDALALPTRQPPFRLAYQFLAHALVKQSLFLFYVSLITTRVLALWLYKISALHRHMHVPEMHRHSDEIHEGGNGRVKRSGAVLLHRIVGNSDI